MTQLQLRIFIRTCKLRDLNEIESDMLYICSRKQNVFVPSVVNCGDTGQPGKAGLIIVSFIFGLSIVDSVGSTGSK